MCCLHPLLMPTCLPLWLQVIFVVCDGLWKTGQHYTAEGGGIMLHVQMLNAVHLLALPVLGGMLCLVPH